MAIQVQLRGGTTAEHSTFTGAAKEVTVDTTKKTLVVHDGSTAGGIPVAKAADTVNLTGAQTVAGVKTLSSNPVLDAGTANAVAFLNGSKVLTTGSALTFDGTVLTTPSLTTTADASGLTTFGRFSSGYAWSLIRPSSTATGIEFRTNAGDVLYQLDQSSGANKHIWYTGAAEQMRLTSTGLGIGTSSPSTKLQINAAGANSAWLYSTNGTSGSYLGTSGSGETIVYQTGAYPIDFFTNSTQRARIDSSGNLLVGTTTQPIGTSRFSVVTTGNTQAAMLVTDTFNYASAVTWNKATANNNLFVEFATETSYTARGSITYNRAGGLTAYNTTSDYRAKDISGPVVNSGALIDATPVYMGKMKGATQERPMFIAHEVPAYAHTGEKDAVDADGKPVYQQMDASALIPVMWAEIQSLRARLAALETN